MVDERVRSPQSHKGGHTSKRLGLVEANISKIAEFGLSLDGQVASWYSQNEISEFADSTNSRKNLSNYSIDASRNGT